MTGIIQKGKYGRYLRQIFTAVDFVVLNMMLALTYWIRPDFLQDSGRTIVLLANLAYIPVAYWFGKTHNDRAVQMDHVVGNCLKELGAHALIFISCLYFVGIDYVPWTDFALFYGLSVVVFPLWWSVSRLMLKSYRKSGHNFSNVVIVGGNANARRLFDELASEAGFGYQVVGYFDTKPGDHMPHRLYGGTLDKLDEFVKHNGVKELFFTLSGQEEETMQQAVRIADANVVTFYYVPQLTNKMIRSFELTAMGSIPALAIRRNPLSGLTNRLLKRGLDVAVSATLMLLSPIVLIPVGIAIKISSPGPIFFRQKRTGYRGRDFECIKFRTMRVNADSDRKQAGRDDPRKTRLGNWLRHYSIDELPQVWNVLKGDMSLVGPRPHMLLHTEEYSQLIDKYMVRHMVKPGITGWAQVNGYRGETKELWQMERRVEHDVWYIEHWSLLLDIKIMVRTVINAVVGERNAF